MSAENKAIIHRWFEEVWNQGREETIDELLTPDATIFGLGESDTVVHGPAEFKPFSRNLRSAFPDLHIRIEDTIAEGSRVVVRVVLEGTHNGNGIGIPPTGRRVQVGGLVVVEVADGKLIAGWNIWDQQGLLRQIGAVPTRLTDRFLAARD
ncbi:MAG TPA: ester cyclase [Candidatus Angelobacter sp.]|nr:ester cyclase [Candidatus Angelobacter sp.]